jgi:shikimate kinase
VVNPDRPRQPEAAFPGGLPLGLAQIIYERVRHQSHRPLLQAPDPLAKITELLAARAPQYKQADLLVGVDFRAPLETARHIAASMRRLQTVPASACS